MIVPPLSRTGPALASYVLLRSRRSTTNRGDFSNSMEEENYLPMNPKSSSKYRLEFSWCSQDHILTKYPPHLNVTGYFIRRRCGGKREGAACLNQGNQHPLWQAHSMGVLGIVVTLEDVVSQILDQNVEMDWHRVMDSIAFLGLVPCLTVTINRQMKRVLEDSSS